MQKVKILDAYFGTTTSTKYRVSILRAGNVAGGWLSNNGDKTEKLEDAEVFNTAEQAKEVAEGLGYEVVD